MKGKIQAAPKELLRRGLLTGTEKLKGQLRDAAEGGRREDTEADRAQDTARRGARLAVDRLGRLASGKKRARSWSGEAVPEDVPQAGSDSQAPGTPVKPNTPSPGAPMEPNIPPSDADPVRIKTRETVHDASVTGYRRTERHKTEQPVVKTKDTYVHRQVKESARMGREAVSARSAGEPVGLDFSAQPEIKIRDSRAQRSQVQYQATTPHRQGREATRKISEPAPPQPLERGRQRFVQERAQQAAERRAKGQGANNVTLIPAKRQGVVDVPPQASSSGSVRTETPSKPKTVWETRSDGDRSVKRARSERGSIGKSGRQKIKSSAESSRQAVQTTNRSANAARQTARAVVQARQRALWTAGEAKRAAATVDRPVVKAAASALRGAVSAIRAAVAPLAAGGGAVIAVVLVLCLVAALIMSPLGIFFSGEETGGQTVADAVREINQEYSAKLMVAYATSFCDFKSRKPLMNLAVILNLFPGVLSMIAVYFILKALGLTNTHLGLILVYSAASGLGYLIAKGFFDTVPRALCEAAKLDGASQARTFISVIIPLSKPIIVYTIISSFLVPWMDFVYAKMIMNSGISDMWTVSIGLYNMLDKALINTYFSQFCAGGVLVSIPISILFVIMQKFYVEGITGGAVKG